MNKLGVILQVPAADPVFELAACDLTESDELVWNVGQHLPSIKCDAKTVKLPIVSLLSSYGVLEVGQCPP